MSEQRTRKTVVYIGVRRGIKEPKLYVWRDLEGKDHNYAPGKKGRNIAFASVGQMYSFEFDEGGSVFSATGRYEGQWENKDEAAAWAAESRAIEADIDLELRAKKESKQHADFEALEPIREAYWRLLPPQRPLLLAQVVAYITRRTGQ